MIDGAFLKGSRAGVVEAAFHGEDENRAFLAFGDLHRGSKQERVSRARRNALALDYRNFPP